MSSFAKRYVFAHPKNMILTQLLQTLAIVRHYAQRSNHSLVYFAFQREPEQRRLLNFGSLAFATQEAAKEAIDRSLKDRDPVWLNSREAKDVVALTVPRSSADGRVGLKEVASVVGIELNVDLLAKGKTSKEPGLEEPEKKDDPKRPPDDLQEAKHAYQGVKEQVEENVFKVNMLLQQRRNESPKRKMHRKQSPVSFIAGASKKVEKVSERQMYTVLRQFGGFYGQMGRQPFEQAEAFDSRERPMRNSMRKER